MVTEGANGRVAQAAADPMFMERWSRRAFSGEPVSDEELRSLMEAARWTPSSHNEQPWLFIYARTPEDRARFVTALTGSNPRWAEKAPLLLFLLCRTTREDGRPNAWARYDAGAAWMSLALQAHRMGLATRAMAGFDDAIARSVLGMVSHDYEVAFGIAVGRPGAPESLDEDLRVKEKPNLRRHLDDVMREGRF